MRTMNLVLKLEIIDVLKTSLSLVKDLTAKDIVNESYVLWITKPRKKTNEVFSIPIIPPAARIIEKYKTLANSKLLGNALPVKSNQKMNDYLKEIGQLAFINKKITMHAARHTFATTVALENNVPLYTVSKCLGHSNIKVTQDYARMTQKKMLFDMQGVMEVYK